MAWDEAGETVALKLLDVRGQTPYEKSWGMREIDFGLRMCTQGQLKHPNLLTPHNVFGKGDIFCIVNEYCPLGMPSSALHTSHATKGSGDCLLMVIRAKFETFLCNTWIFFRRHPALIYFVLESCFVDCIAIA